MRRTAAIFALLTTMSGTAQASSFVALGDAQPPKPIAVEAGPSDAPERFSSPSIVYIDPPVIAARVDHGTETSSISPLDMDDANRPAHSSETMAAASGQLPLDPLQAFAPKPAMLPLDPLNAFQAQPSAGPRLIALSQSVLLVEEPVAFAAVKKAVAADGKPKANDLGHVPMMMRGGMFSDPFKAYKAPEEIAKADKEAEKKEEKASPDLMPDNETTTEDPSAKQDQSAPADQPAINKSRPDWRREQARRAQ